ncbi:MAG TPA: hypothetical protein PK537_08795 [Candidatus Limiplasma sp.]|nr:hypothetical protein [Candidatus Limiplasma sp.]
MSSQNIRKMVTTALIIALAIVFQMLRPVLGGSNIISTYIIGSLVNLCLIVAAVAVGLWSGIVVAVITPLIALMQGHVALVQLVPWIIAGNAVLVLIYAFFGMKDKTSLSVSWPRWAIVGVIAAVVKFAVMAFGQSTVLTSVKSLTFGVAFPTSVSAQVVQIITAVIAMIISGIVLPMLPAKVVGKNA